MTAGHKIGRSGKGVPKQAEPDTPAEVQTTTQVEKCQADDLGKTQSVKRQKVKQVLQRKVVNLKAPPCKQNIFLRTKIHSPC